MPFSTLGHVYPRVSHDLWVMWIDLIQQNVDIWTYNDITCICEDYNKRNWIVVKIRQYASAHKSKLARELVGIALITIKTLLITFHSWNTGTLASVVPRELNIVFKSTRILGY